MEKLKFLILVFSQIGNDPRVHTSEISLLECLL